MHGTTELGIHIYKFLLVVINQSINQSQWIVTELLARGSLDKLLHCNDVGFRPLVRVSVSFNNVFLSLLIFEKKHRTIFQRGCSIYIIVHIDFHVFATQSYAVKLQMALDVACGMQYLHSRLVRSYLSLSVCLSLCLSRFTRSDDSI